MAKYGTFKYGQERYGFTTDWNEKDDVNNTWEERVEPENSYRQR